MIVLSMNFYMFFFREEKLSLNLAISKNASLPSRGHWLLDHVPSQRIIHRLIEFVAFALVSVFWLCRSEKLYGCKAFHVHVVSLLNLV